MGSKWRFNIPDLGAVTAGYALMARLLSGPWVDGYLCERGYNAGLKVIVFPVIFDGVLNFPVAETFVTNASFPLAMDVEPDSM